MSDNEMNGVSAVDQHSDDESSASMKIVEKSAKVVKNDDNDDSDVENDHSSSTNNGFGADGEPDYKPRKVKLCRRVQIWKLKPTVLKS
jgi:hypothetical protein